MPIRNVEFMHELSMSNDLDTYERRQEERRRNRAADRDTWNIISNSIRLSELPEVLELPPTRDILSFRPSGTQTRLFNSRIYITSGLIDQVPDELAPRIITDSMILAQVTDTMHEEHSVITTRTLCGLWQLSQAMQAWGIIQYRCYGCGREEVIRGNPTRTQN